MQAEAEERAITKARLEKFKSRRDREVFDPMRYNKCGTLLPS